MDSKNGWALLALALAGLLLLSWRQGQQLRVTNAETWEWVDWQGKTRKAIVHRDVQSN